ncbi:hypothetical protein Tco_0672821 [Tanacetum coccineum]
MSKNGTVANKAKQQRIPNKNQKFTNNVAQDKSMKLRRFMDSRSSVRQGALAQRRSNFQGNQFPLTTQAARKAAVAPIRNRNFHQNQATTSYKPSVDLRLESFAAIILGVSARSLGCSSNESTEAANTKAVHGWKFTLVAIFPISGLFSVSSFVKLRNGKYNAGSFLGLCLDNFKIGHNQMEALLQRMLCKSTLSTNSTEGGIEAEASADIGLIICKHEGGKDENYVSSAE